MDVGLVGLGLFGGEAAEPRENPRSDADGDQLFGIAGNGAAHAAGAAKFGIRRLGDVGKVDLAVRDMLGAPCGSRGAR